MASSAAEKMAARVGKKIVLGIRPEDIVEAVHGGATVDCRVEVVEPMGNEIFVYLKAGADSFVARMPVSRSRWSKRVSYLLQHGKSAFF